MKNRIIVVDDDENIRGNTQELLSMEGYEVTTCATGEDIVETVETLHPHLILLDIHLGRYDGREICKSLKSNPKTSHIPVVMISADEGLYNTIVTAGANDVLTKPFSDRTLLSRVESLVSRFKIG